MCNMRPTQGSSADRKYRKRIKRIIKEDMAIGVRLNKHYIESTVRNNTDIPSGCAYRKRPKNSKWKYII